ncbi:MAG: hypothetical protein AAFX46_05290 [Cyanobacteria bacterium J06636_27]
MANNIYSISENLEEFAQIVHENWEKGYVLMDAESGDDNIFGVFEKRNQSSGYIGTNSYDELKTTIGNASSQGYDIVGAEYVDGVWLGVFGEDDGGIAYSNSPVTLDALRGQIHSQWDNGYNLVDVEYNDNGWVGIYGKDFGATGYGIANSLEEFYSQFNSQTKEGLGKDLVGVEYGDGKWFGIYKNTPSFSGYSVAGSLDEFETQIANWEENGFDLVDVAHGDGTWMGVYEITTSYSLGLYMEIGFNDHNMAMAGIRAVSAGADSLSSF